MTPKTKGSEVQYPSTRRLTLPAFVFGLLFTPFVLAAGDGTAAVGAVLAVRWATW